MATQTRLTVALTLIVSVTILSWFVGTRGGPHPTDANLAISGVVIFIALLKARVIMREFMEVGLAPAWVRWASDAWLVLFLAAPFVVHFATH